MTTILKILGVCCYMTVYNTGFAQQQPVLTAADYARAEQSLSYNTAPLVDRSKVQPNWLNGDRFWYRILTAQGSEFIVVDAAKGKKEPAFNHAQLAAALSAATGNQYTPSQLPFTSFTYLPGGAIGFSAAKKNWVYSPAANTCTIDAATAAPVKSRSNESVSPDGKRSVFIRNYNLWMKDIATNKETPLTTDGVKDNGYATDNAGWRKSDNPIVVWSPDSKKIATYQQDQRNVSDMYLVTTNVGKPSLQAWKYPLPGDKDVTTIRRVIIELDNARMVALKIPAGVRRGTQCDDISCDGKDFSDVEWNSDGTALAFVSTTRDHKQETFWIADAASGALREVFNETSATQFESGQGTVNWHYMQASHEIIWFSERDNWGHLYLYDAATGKLKNQITRGSWAITQVLKIDEQKRLIYFLANGKEAGRHPYFNHFYRVGFDGKGLTLLSPENGHHLINLSPTGNYFTDSYSTPDTPPVTVLRNNTGKQLALLEKADISRLTATGWQPPAPITVKARDGQIDLYGLLFTPYNLDPAKKYPVVNYIYPGPQGGSVGSWSFETGRSDHQALANLGFIVVLIEGTCNPNRSKSFHDMCYGNMADNTLPDQIAGIKQLAKQYPYMDLDRVGIWGHSGGGFATAAAMFRFPDFYKVGISESGNHDNRNYEDDWGERYIGLLTTHPDGTSNYEEQANQNYAKNLKGKLMLAHGMLDDNVPPYNTLLVVEALEKANKDFDLVIFPNSRHGYGDKSLYMTRKRWDYFVRNLMGGTPPQEYELKMKTDKRNAVQ